MASIASEIARKARYDEEGCSAPMLDTFDEDTLASVVDIGLYRDGSVVWARPSDGKWAVATSKADKRKALNEMLGRLEEFWFNAADLDYEEDAASWEPFIDNTRAALADLD